MQTDPFSDACFEVSEALSADGARPSAVERALNAFADALSRAEVLSAGPADAFAELRAGVASVNRASLPPAAFAAMAKAVQRYLDSVQRSDPDDLLRHLRDINATSTKHSMKGIENNVRA